MSLLAFAGSSVQQELIRGLSREQVCIPCAINRKGLSIAKAANTGRVSAKDLHKVFDDKISKDAVLVTDKHNSYPRFANANGIELVQLKSKDEERKGIYNIQHVNAYHSELKRFIRSNFKGVSTKYLDNYLAWNNFKNYAPETDIEKSKILLIHALTTHSEVTSRTLSKRPPKPI